MSAFVRELVGRPGRNGGRSAPLDRGGSAGLGRLWGGSNTGNDRRDLFEDRLEMAAVPVRGWDWN